METNSGLWTRPPGDSTLVGERFHLTLPPAGLASHNGVLYCVDDAGAELWIVDTTTPGDSTLVGTFPVRPALTIPQGLTSHDPNPTPAVTNYTVDAGDVVWAFSIPQPTIQHTIHDPTPDASAPTITIATVSAGTERTTVTLSATVTGGTYDDLDYAWTVGWGTLDDATAESPVWTRPSGSSDQTVAIGLTTTAPWNRNQRG